MTTFRIKNIQPSDDWYVSRRILLPPSDHDGPCRSIGIGHGGFALRLPPQYDEDVRRVLRFNDPLVEWFVGPAGSIVGHRRVYVGLENRENP